jgi:hypothetical protein
MSAGRLWTVLVLLVLTFIGAIFMESRMPQYAALELVIIVVGILLSIIALIGIASESRWAWPYATILFSLSLANILFLYLNVPAIGTFLVLLAVNIFGLMLSILSIEDIEEAVSTWNATPEAVAPLETYALASEPQVTYKTGNGTAKAEKKPTRKRKR